MKSLQILEKKELNIRAYAKINLFLDINYKRSDGYHDISSVMQTISLYDEIKIEIIDSGIEIICDDDKIPTDESNTCYKAAELMLDESNIDSGIRITIVKKIPTEAGLGGGSADCAAAIEGINYLFSLNLSMYDMINIGARIGADVPFCLVRGTCLCEGIGEKITSLNPFRWDGIVLVKPEFSVSTKDLYEQCTYSDYKLNDLKKFIDIMDRCSKRDTIMNSSNTLERVAVRKYGKLEIIKEELSKAGCFKSLMTGSGSVVVGFFEKGEKENIMKILSGKYEKIYFVKTKAFDEKWFFR